MSKRNVRRGRGRQSGGTPFGRRPRRSKFGAGKGARRRYRPGEASSARRQGRSVFSNVARAPKSKKSQDDSNFNAAADRGFRLQQVLAAAGYGSRRQCEAFITEGRVEVDGQIVTELGVRVKPGEQKIRVDGEGLPKVKPVYVALNKPKNTLCTNSDPQGRRRAIDFLPDELGRLFPVGRLDKNSEGLLLLTNDGALAQRLAHPSYKIPKTYRVQVAGLVDYELVNALKRGVHIAEGIVQADDATIRSSHKRSSTLEITLTEGKNREIRRMLARVGHKVMQLRRVQLGTIKLGRLGPGEYRHLTASEVAELYRLAETLRNAPEIEEAPRRQAPIEVSALEALEAEKALSREDSKALERSRARQASKNDSEFAAEGRQRPKRGSDGAPRRFGSKKISGDGERFERRGSRQRGALRLKGGGAKSLRRRKTLKRAGDLRNRKGPRQRRKGR
ncbi:MAG: pseudouridine synthase [Thermoguttaceae bacterium]|jgi:23S rRNA pseudouridine2605 synthase